MNMAGKWEKYEKKRSTSDNWLLEKTKNFLLLKIWVLKDTLMATVLL
jgi:hypothetical protein